MKSSRKETLPRTLPSPIFFGFDTAENEPSKVCRIPRFEKRIRSSAAQLGLWEVISAWSGTDDQEKCSFVLNHWHREALRAREAERKNAWLG